MNLYSVTMTNMLIHNTISTREENEEVLQALQLVWVLWALLQQLRCSSTRCSDNGTNIAAAITACSTTTTTTNDNNNTNTNNNATTAAKLCPYAILITQDTSASTPKLYRFRYYKYYCCKWYGTYDVCLITMSRPAAANSSSSSGSVGTSAAIVITDPYVLVTHNVIVRSLYLLY